MLGECLIRHSDGQLVLVDSQEWPTQYDESINGIVAGEVTDDPFYGVWNATADTDVLYTLDAESQTAIEQSKNWSNKARTLHGTTC